MEEKKFSKGNSSVWPFFGFGRSNQSFLGKSDSSKTRRFLRILVGKKGFTLIELIVVIGILGLLATTAMALLNPIAQFQKANDAKRKADLSQIQKALESYYQDNQSYPDSLTYQLDPITTPPSGKTKLSWGTSWQPYMNVLPKDPTLNRQYVYYSPATLPDGTPLNGQGYCLYANLERAANDSSACKADGTKCENSPDGACGANGAGIDCNFGICSPNAKP
jgi:type IV pilus assembly protein PilA